MSKKDENKKGAEDLVIAAKFPPVTSTSGIVFAKRILNDKKDIDLVQGQFKGALDEEFNQVLEDLIDNRIIIDMNPYSDSVDNSEKFRKDGMKAIDSLNKEYKTLKTRCFPTTNHFLAFEYKMNHPETTWIAEFSDPIRVNLENKRRGKSESYHYKNEEFLNQVNSKIQELNEANNKNFPLIKKGETVYFIAEYLAYLFADKIIFTNPNQQEIMLSGFPYDIEGFVLEKSEIKIHPTLSEEYYHIKETDYEVDDECINLGYFGTYLAKRNFETLFYSMESLDDDLKHKVKLHLFISDDEDGGNLKNVIKNLDIHKDIIINDKVPLFEFLNITTKLDVLIVNDSLTKSYFEKNPFLPSKYSDYLGSGNDIWAICEENSVLDNLDIKYKSYIDDYKSTKETLHKIIEDKFNVKAIDLSLEEELIEENNYLKSRVNYLNQIMPKNDAKAKDNQIDKLKRENAKLKRKNSEILNSNSWKLTKVFRKSKKPSKKIKVLISKLKSFKIII